MSSCMEGRESMGKGPLHDALPWWLYLPGSMSYGANSPQGFCCSCLILTDLGTRLFSVRTVKVLVAFQILDFSLIPFLKRGKRFIFLAPIPLTSTGLAHTLPLNKDIFNIHRGNLSWYSLSSQIWAQTCKCWIVVERAWTLESDRHIWMQNPFFLAVRLGQSCHSESQLLFICKFLEPFLALE